MRILILGASGFLGSILTNHLSEKHSIIAVLREQSSTEALDSKESIEVRRENPSRWARVVRETKPDIVVAAFWNGVKKTERNNRSTQYDNTELHKELALVCRELQIDTFLDFGSQAEFVPSEFPIPEVASCDTTSAYGEAKKSLLSDLEGAFLSSTTRFIWARVFSIYGPSDRSDSLINGVTTAIKNHEHFWLRSPQTKWSFLYEKDFARAIEKILENGPINGIINVGNPKPEYIGAISRVLNSPLIHPIDPLNSNESGYYPLTGKLESIGWKPEFSLADGLEDTIKTRLKY